MRDKLILVAGFEPVTFPDDERIDERYRGKTVTVHYDARGVHAGGWHGPELEGYAKQWVLDIAARHEQLGD